MKLKARDKTPPARLRAPLLAYPSLALAALFAPAPALAASLEGIQGALGDPSGRNDVARVVATVGALIFVAAALFMWRYLRERGKNLASLGWIDSPKQIRHILANAVRYRSTFELQFPHRGVQRRPILRCSSEDISQSGLSLEAEGIKNIARNWTDRLVNCYFKINVNGQHVYYAFSTRIKRVEIKPRGRCSLTLHLPDKLENRQKRAFLRIVPPQEYMLGAVLWLGRHLPKAEDLPHMGRWPRPALVTLPGKEKQQFEIADISAGGVRVTIPRREMMALGLELGVAEQLVMLLDLLNPDDRGRLRFWLLCRVQNFAAQYDTHNIETGLQFLAWASPKEDQSELEWHRLSRSLEVDLLGNWIIRRHLELFRDHPEADSPYLV